MKEIKFRQLLKEQYQKNGERYHYWGYFGQGFTSPMGANIVANGSEQFTGLTDKNGVDIYEGDILKAYHSEFQKKFIAEVKFKEGTFTIGRYWKDGIYDWHSMEQYVSFDLEAIGNIHENPEILD